MNSQGCINEILIAGTDDWVPLAEIVGIVQEDGGVNSQEQIRELSLKLIREVVRQGLMEIGVPPEKDAGERPLLLKRWPGTPEEWLDRIEREWHNLVETPNFGYGCWLQNTMQGNEIGCRLIKEQDGSVADSP